MDQRLQRLYRDYLQEGSLSAYMIYYLATKQAGTNAGCWNRVGECPHCVLAQIDRLYSGLPELETIRYQLLQMFLHYELTPNGTYLLRQAPLPIEDTAPYLPALYFTLIPRKGPYILGQQESMVRVVPPVPRLANIRGHGELCWGNVGGVSEKKSKDKYGFTEWPQYENAQTGEDFHPTLDRWIEEIQFIGNNCGAVYANIEAKPEGIEFTRPELGPLNFHADKWSMVRITFLDEEGHQPPQHETLFIGQCLENLEECYGLDTLERI